MKKYIPNNYKFSFPQDIREIKYKDKFIIISPETANWFVLNNDQQVSFFHLLQKYNIDTAINKYSGQYSDAKATILQIVARHFEDKDVKSCISEDTKQLHFYLTNNCNLRCPHCYMYSGEKVTNELTTEEVCKALFDFSRIGGKSVTFSGGEVSLRKDFFDIVKYAHLNDLRVRILTNGTLWNTSTIKNISSLIDSVQISIDGYSEESNAKVRGKRNFNKSLLAIDGFISEGVSTEMAITIPYWAVENNEGNFYVDFCRKMLMKYPSDLFKIKISEQLIEGRGIHLTEEQNLLYYKYVTSLKSQINGWCSELESFVRAFSKKEIMDNCMYGVFSIDSSGDVFFCSRVSSLKPVCNIRSTSFERIWKLSKKAQDLSNINNFKPCCSCELKYICGGGCRIDYFPLFSEITDIENVDMSIIPERNCTIELKERFYRLMIEANERLFV